MRILVNREALKTVLRLFGNVVPLRTPKPILTCVKAVAKNKTLTLTGTNMEMSIVATLTQVSVSEEGETVIPYEKLAGIADVSQSDTITLAAERDNTITAKADNSSFRIFTYDKDEFPPISMPEMNGSLALPAAILRSAVDRTEWSAATGPTRYAIDGILFEGAAKKFVMTATDGHRLAHVKVVLESPSEVKFNAIVPAKAVKVLNRAIQDGDIVRLQTEVSGGSVLPNRLTMFILADGAEHPHITITCALMEGTFPPYGDVIPKETAHKFKCSRKALDHALRQAMVFTSEESKGLRMHCTGSTVEFSARDPEKGEAKVQVPMQRVAGEGEVLIGFNPSYVRDFVDAATTEEIGIELNTGNKAGLLRSGPDYLYVVMPVNLS